MTTTKLTRAQLVLLKYVRGCLFGTFFDDEDGKRFSATRIWHAGRRDWIRSEDRGPYVITEAGRAVLAEVEKVE